MPPILRCKACLGEIPHAEIHAEEGYAWCALCFIAHPLAGQTLDSTSRDARRVSRPDSFKVVETLNELTIRRRWYAPPAWLLVLFCGMWNSFVWYGLMQRTVGILFVAIVALPVGLLLFYGVLCSFLNVTEITVAGGRLRIRHLPLPWPWKQQDIPTAQIVQLYCRMQEDPTRHKGVFLYSPRLHVVRSDRSEIDLFNSLHPVLQEALFIEQTIERFLGISEPTVADPRPRP